jgi:DNA polymerase-4
MDAFYASVEVREDPSLRGKPVIVGGGNRGVVLSATYEARRFGVGSAMPMAWALRQCPGAIVVPPRHELYAEASAAVMAAFRDVTPVVQPLSLDEAFLDVRGATRLLGSPRQIGASIKERILADLKLTCTVGAASTMFIAKLASTQGKPDGLLVVPPDDVLAFLHPLPVGALWGVGARTGEVLARLGLRTVGDLAHTPVDTLQHALGESHGAHLADLAWGRDPRRVTGQEHDRSIGADETFPRDVDDPELVRRELLRLSDRVARRLRSAGLEGRTITLKVRFADFRTITRSRTLREPTDVTQVLYATVTELYAALGIERARLRLVGVRAEGLVDAGSTPSQLSFDEPARDRREVEVAADRAGQRFGSGAVRPGSLVVPPGGDSLW